MPKITAIKSKAESIGARIDALYALRNQRLSIQKEVDALKTKEGEIQLEILEILKSSDLAKASGTNATFSWRTEPVAQVSDWDKLTAYIRKNDAFDLLQRRLNQAAINERWEAGKKVAGIEAYLIDKISLTASGK